MITYLQGGEAATAAKMNELFAGLDAKLNIYYGGKSPLWWEGLAHAKVGTGYVNGLYESFPQFYDLSLGNVHSALMGIPFFFYGAEHPLVADPVAFTAVDGSTGIRGSYDEAPFRQMAATAPVAAYYSVEKQAVALTGLPATHFYGQSTGYNYFDRSLQAHVRKFTPPGGVEGDYWIYDGSLLQRRQRWSQAEIVVEGLTTLGFLDRWDKYDFFRIHNLGTEELAVHFEIHFSITVPPGECRCVRRDGVAGTYTAGTDYFQRFLPGDPRLYCAVPVNTGSDAFINGLPPSSPVAAIGANNVACPAMVKGWVDGLEAIGRVAWDAHGAADGGLLLKECFAGVDDTGEVQEGAALGDLLVNAGEVGLVQASTGALTRIPYDDWPDLKAKLTAAGCALGTDANGQVTVQKAGFDLAAIGSSVLSDGGLDLRHGVTWHPRRVVASIDDPLSLGATFSRFVEAADGNEGVRPITETTEARPGVYYGWSMVGGVPTIGAAVPVAKAEKRLTRSLAATVPARRLTLESTAEELVRLDAFAATVPDRCVDAQARLTCQGLVVECSEEVLMTAPGLATETLGLDFWRQAGLYFGQVIDPAHWDMDAGQLIRKRVWLLGRYFGWPNFGGSMDYWGYESFLGTPPPRRWDDVMFVGPRRTRSWALAVLIYYSLGVDGTWIKGYGLNCWEDMFAGGPALRGYSAPTWEYCAAAGAAVAVAGLSTKPSEVRCLGTMALFYPTTALTYVGEKICSGAPVQALAAWRNPDVLLELMDHWTEPGWYAANRARLLLNQVGTSSEAQDDNWLRLICPELAAEHFNNLSSMVNAMAKILPLDWNSYWAKVGTRWIKAPAANSVGPYGTTVRPRNQYCSFAAGSDAYLFFEALGVPILIDADLPDSHADLVASEMEPKEIQFTARVTVTSRNSPTYGSPYGVRIDNYAAALASVVIDPTATPVNRNYLNALTVAEVFGTGAVYSDLSNYFWVAVEDVKAKAAALGLAFSLQRLVVPMRLAEFAVSDIAVPDVIGDDRTGLWFAANPDGTSNHDLAVGYEQTFDMTPTGFKGNYWRLVPAASLEECDWVKDATVLRLEDWSGDDLICRALVDVENIDPMPASEQSEGGYPRVINVTPGNWSISVGLVMTDADQFSTVNYDSTPQTAWTWLCPPPSQYEHAYTLTVAAIPATMPGQASWGLPTGMECWPAALFQSWVSAGLPQNSKGILIPAPRLRFENADPLALVTLGPRVMPATAEAAEGEASGIELPEEENWIAAGEGAQDLVVMGDCWKETET